MKILYGVAGVGFGHASRASTIIRHLQSKGHVVKVITYGQGYEAMKDEFDVFKVRGPEIHFAKGIVKKRKTLRTNLKNTKTNIWGWKRYKNLMDEFKPDILITDMDPIVAILRNIYRLPMISIDNQHRMTNLELDIPPSHYTEYLVAKNVVNFFAHRADVFIVTSFAKLPITRKKTFVVPPIIRSAVRKIRPTYNGPTLVYLSRKDAHVLSVLKHIDRDFVVYGYDVVKTKNNLHFRKKETFLKDLQSCDAIIATAGFTLISEALSLKKPYLAIPLKGQFEQVLNALAIKKAGFGDYSESLTKEQVTEFLSNLKKYKNKLANYNPDYDALFKVLDRKLKRYEK